MGTVQTATCRKALQGEPGGGHTLEVSSLEVNTQLDQDIFDKRGILLLAAGSTITERFLDQLKRHRITTVTAKASPNNPTTQTQGRIPPQTYPTGPLKRQRRKTLDAMIENSSFEGLWIRNPRPSKDAAGTQPATQ